MGPLPKEFKAFKGLVQGNDGPPQQKYIISYRRAIQCEVDNKVTTLKNTVVEKIFPCETSYTLAVKLLLKRGLTALHATKPPSRYFPEKLQKEGILFFPIQEEQTGSKNRMAVRVYGLYAKKAFLSNIPSPTPPPNDGSVHIQELPDT